MRGLRTQEQGKLGNIVRVGELSGWFFSSSNFVRASSLEILSRSAIASICFCTSGVSTQPGQIALQVIGSRAVSSAVTLVSPIKPCFADT